MTKKGPDVYRLDRQLSLKEFETLLDSGQLYTEARNGNWWQCRRNGMTKTWKRDSTRWEVPIKAGFRDCMRINDNTSMGYFGKVAGPEDHL